MFEIQNTPSVKIDVLEEIFFYPSSTDRSRRRKLEPGFEFKRFKRFRTVWVIVAKRQQSLPIAKATLVGGSEKTQSCLRFMYLEKY